MVLWYCGLVLYIHDFQTKTRVIFHCLSLPSQLGWNHQGSAFTCWRPVIHTNLNSGFSSECQMKILDTVLVDLFFLHNFSSSFRDSQTFLLAVLTVRRSWSLWQIFVSCRLWGSHLLPAVYDASKRPCGSCHHWGHHLPPVRKIKHAFWFSKWWILVFQNQSSFFYCPCETTFQESKSKSQCGGKWLLPH